MVDPLHSSALTLGKQIASGETSSEELTRYFLARIERHNPQLQAFTDVMPRRALRAARQADSKLQQHRVRNGGQLPDNALSPLFGVPCGIKDLVPVRATPTRLGSRAYRHFVSPVTGRVAKRIMDAGMVVLGKLATSELGAMPITEPDIHPPTRNPWNTAHTPGGSSGGSGSAVASGLLPLAHGSDGAGSVRIPAAFCHLYGFKPSRTLLGNLHGAVNTLGLSVMGPLTHDVADAAAMLDAMAGHHHSDRDDCLLHACQQPLAPLQILFCNASPLGHIHPEVKDAARRTADLLASLGHTIKEVEAPEGSVEEFLPLWNHQMARIPIVSDRLLQPTTRYLRQGGRHLQLSAVRAQQRVLDRRIRDFFGDADMLLTPTVPILPPAVGEFDHLGAAERFFAVAHCGAFTALFNISGQPAASLPLGLSANGLPLGMQLVGRVGGDGDVLKLSRQVEQATPWGDRRAPSYWPSN